MDRIFSAPNDVTNAMKMVFEKSIPTQFYTIIKKHTDFYLLVRMYKFQDKYIACLIRNVTNLVKAYKSIERNRNLMGHMLNSIKTGIMVINSKGKLTFVNNFAKEMLSIKNAEEILKKIRLPENIKYKFLKVLHGRETCEGCEVEITTASGLSKWFSVYATNMFVGNKKMVIISFNDITQKHLKSKQLEYLSFHDSMTGLYNRRYFEEELNRLFNKRSIPLSLVLIDLNGLKIVNDILGHKMGDELIMKAAELLSISTRASDIVARIGGDEFAIILPNTSKKGVEKLISRIEAKIEEFNLKDDMLISISWGYAVHDGQFRDPEELFKAADNELYKNKYTKSRRKTLFQITKWATSFSTTPRNIDEKYIIEREEITPQPILNEKDQI